MRAFRFFHFIYTFVRKRPQAIFFDTAFAFSIAILSFIACTLHIPFFIRSRGGLGDEFLCRHKNAVIGQIYQRYKRIIASVCFSLSSHIFAVSKYHKKQIEGLSIRSQKISVIYNPLPRIRAVQYDEASRFKAQCKLPMEASLLLAVTNFDYPLKFKPLIEALPHINRTIQSYSEWILVIMGDGTWRNRTQKHIRKNMPELQNIFFAGYYSPMQEAYKAADIVMYFSGLDSACNVAMESQLFEKPLLVNNHPAIQELIDQRTVPVISSPEEIEQTLAYLLSNSLLRQELGRKGKQCISQKIVYDDLQDQLYRTMLNSL
jgi:glycosyltransferase involved in cell wall biosynthesis